jgi:hypothetical protein
VYIYASQKSHVGKEKKEGKERRSKLALTTWQVLSGIASPLLPLPTNRLIVVCLKLGS